MKPTKIEGFAVSQLAKLSNKTRHAVEEWLSNNGVKPVIPELLYPPDTLDKLLAAKVGRPKKPTPAENPQNPQKPPKQG